MRQNREWNLMEVAQTIAQRGTCERLHVGAVIARASRIISTGYNGAPSGMPHCNHTEEEVLARRGCDKTIHAECNAIAAAARAGVATEGATMYVTHMPCYQCAKIIVNSGITGVIYDEPYRVTDGVELLGDAGILVCDIRTLTSGE